MGLVFWCKVLWKKATLLSPVFSRLDDQRGLERYQGFLDAMQNQGLTVPDRNICWYTTQELDDFRQSQDISFLKNFWNGSPPTALRLFVRMTLLHGCYGRAVAWTGEKDSNSCFPFILSSTLDSRLLPPHHTFRNHNSTSRLQYQLPYHICLAPRHNTDTPDTPAWYSGRPNEHKQIKRTPCPLAGSPMQLSLPKSHN